MTVLIGGVDLQVVAVGMLVMLLLLAWRLHSKRPAHPEPPGAPLPPDTAVAAQPLLTAPEAALYNELRLAVQDQYLVFCKVPVWSFLETSAAEDEAHVAFRRRLATRRVDFVLVHPGTLAVEKVVELDPPGPATPQRKARNQLVEGVCKRAGIPVVRLNEQNAYTVPALQDKLGLSSET